MGARVDAERRDASLCLALWQRSRARASSSFFLFSSVAVVFASGRSSVYLLLFFFNRTLRALSISRFIFVYKVVALALLYYIRVRVSMNVSFATNTASGIFRRCSARICDASFDGFLGKVTLDPALQIFVFE